MGTLNNFLFRAGGGKRDRTADLLHAMQALSQLSYTPASKEKVIIERICGFVKTILARFSNSPALARSQNLARIHQTVRIETLLDAPHELQLKRILVPLDLVALELPQTMLG